MAGLPWGRVVTEPADEELIARYRDGDAQAFKILVRRHQRPLYNFTLRQVHSPSTAEDIVQDVFVRIVHNVETFKAESKFTTWAYTIARNLCIDHLRKRVHRRHPSLDAPVSESEGGATLMETVAGKGAGADRSAINKQLQEHLRTAVEALPDDQREVFLLRQVSDLPFKEIAEIVGVGENTVKSRMRYALERLQAALSEFEDYAKGLSG